jgi:hypothetical protein
MTQEIKIGRTFTNSTRPQLVEVLNVGRNVQKPSDKEVDRTTKVEYKVIQSTSANQITEFICTLERFERLYH